MNQEVKNYRSYNALANTKNPYQTNSKKVLCVCSAGLLRSPTMANVLHQEYGYNTRAAGVYADFALVPVTDALVYWADEIVVAEEHHWKDLVNRFDIEAPVHVLNLPDQYEWNHPELRALIKERYANLQKQKDTGTRQ